MDSQIPALFANSSKTRYVWGPPPRKNVVHGNSVGLYQLQIDVFCEDICLGVEQWFEDVKQNQAVISGMQELIQISPYDILSPWIKFE